MHDNLCSKTTPSNNILDQHSAIKCLKNYYLHSYHHGNARVVVKCFKEMFTIQGVRFNQAE